MNEPLSPDIQAILDYVCANTEPDCDTQHLIAAALRAAVDQAFPMRPSMYCSWVSTPVLTAEQSRANLLSIADELEEN